MKGINLTTKREKVVDIFKNGKLELLASTETKLKGREKYHGLELMSSLPVFWRWKDLGKGRPVERCVAQCSGKIWVCQL